LAPLFPAAVVPIASFPRSTRRIANRSETFSSRYHSVATSAIERAAIQKNESVNVLRVSLIVGLRRSYRVDQNVVIDCCLIDVALNTMEGSDKSPQRNTIVNESNTIGTGPVRIQSDPHSQDLSAFDRNLG